MSPVDFNPNNKSIDLQKKTLGTQESIPETPQRHSSDQEKVNASNDRFSKSILLESLQNSSKNVLNETAQKERITTLKNQITHKLLPILSEKENDRLSSARLIAEKLIRFEKQMDILDKK